MNQCILKARKKIAYCWFELIFTFLYATVGSKMRDSGETRVSTFLLQTSFFIQTHNKTLITALDLEIQNSSSR
jgi:hypothetical protein